MLEIGKAKPDKMKNGLSTKKLVENACCWVVQTVEMSRPSASVLSRNSAVPSSSTSGLPTNGTWNHSTADGDDQRDLAEADKEKRHGLAEDELGRPYRRSP